MRNDDFQSTTARWTTVWTRTEPPYLYRPVPARGVVQPWLSPVLGCLILLPVPDGCPGSVSGRAGQGGAQPPRAAQCRVVKRGHRLSTGMGHVRVTARVSRRPGQVARGARTAGAGLGQEAGACPFGELGEHVPGLDAEPACEFAPGPVASGFTGHDLGDLVPICCGSVSSTLALPLIPAGRCQVDVGRSRWGQGWPKATPQGRGLDAGGGRRTRGGRHG